MYQWKCHEMWKFQKVKSKGDKIGHGYDLSRVWRTRRNEIDRDDCRDRWSSSDVFKGKRKIEKKKKKKFENQQANIAR